MKKNIVITIISGGCSVFLFLLFLLLLAEALPVSKLYAAIPGCLFIIGVLFFVKYGIIVARFLKKLDVNSIEMINLNETAEYIRTLSGEIHALKAEFNEITASRSDQISKIEKLLSQQEGKSIASAAK
jgi:hypothetical protein